MNKMSHEERRRYESLTVRRRARIFYLLRIRMVPWPVAGLVSAHGKDGHMTGEDWRRLADYVVARRVELGMRDRRAFSGGTGGTGRELGKLRDGDRGNRADTGKARERAARFPQHPRHGREPARLGPRLVPADTGGRGT